MHLSSLRVIADCQTTPCAISEASMANLMRTDILSFLSHHLSDLLPTNTGATKPVPISLTISSIPSRSMVIYSHSIPVCIPSMIILLPMGSKNHPGKNIWKTSPSYPILIFQHIFICLPSFSTLPPLPLILNSAIFSFIQFSSISSKTI